jgi:hypothetical protein
MVTLMLQTARLRPTDIVHDLDAGEARIPIAAARTFAARAVGFEHAPEIAALAFWIVPMPVAGECSLRLPGEAAPVRLQLQQAYHQVSASSRSASGPLLSRAGSRVPRCVSTAPGRTARRQASPPPLPPTAGAS